jgi:hypothetical protein
VGSFVAIQYSHFSPLSGLTEKPENYHAVTIKLSVDGNQTHVSLNQDNNATEEARVHSEKNWGNDALQVKEDLGAIDLGGIIRYCNCTE